MAKDKTYTKFQVRRAVDSALQDAYMKHIGGWEAKIFSANFNSFVEDKTLEYLEKPKY